MLMVMASGSASSSKSESRSKSGLGLLLAAAQALEERSSSSSVCAAAVAGDADADRISDRRLDGNLGGSRVVIASTRKRKLHEDLNSMSSSCSSKSSRSNHADAPGRVEVGAATAGDADRISDLPDCILGSILSRLHIKELLRTSILSRRWRHLWTLAPLDITDYFVYGVTFAKGTGKNEFRGRDDCYDCLVFRAMITILTLHRGPIHSFTLNWSFRAPFCEFHYTRPIVYSEIVDLWTNALAQRRIRSLTMKSKLPSNLLACQSLRTLELIDVLDLNRETPSLPPNLRELKLRVAFCAKRVPPLAALPRGVLACESLCLIELSDYRLKDPFGMEMPPNLRELRLSSCWLSDTVLVRVLSNCKLLDTLDLYRARGLKKVRISSSSLRRLRLRFVHKCPLYLLIEDVPNLELLELDSFVMEPLTRVRIIGAPPPKNLQLEKNCFQEGLMTPQIYTLKALSVKVSLDDTYHTKLLADLLRCFPCLESLDVEVCEHCIDPVDEDYWEHEASPIYLIPHLKVVKLKGFKIRPNHLRFVRYLVRNVQILKEVSFYHQLEHEKRWVETKRILLQPWSAGLL